MVSVTVGNSTERKTVIVEETSTPIQVLRDNNIPTGSAVLYLNGNVMSERESNKSLKDLGITDEAMIFAVVKTSNG